METSYDERWPRDVQDVLKRYGDAAALERHAARHWPAVKALMSAGVNPVVAIRRVLAEAITTLETAQPLEARLLRESYQAGQPIEVLAATYAADPSNLHRRRNKAVQEIAVIIAEFNRRAERLLQAQRFTPRHPVHGFDRLVADLMAQLHSPHGPPIIVVQGMGGLGKTTLAQLVAQECAREDRFKGVLWASAKQADFDIWAGIPRARGMPAVQTDDLVAELARELGITMPTTAQATRDEVAAHCRYSPYLIVFDNLETVADMAALAPLLDILAGQSRILITSRDRAPEAFPPAVARAYVTLHELDAPTSFEVLRDAARTSGATSLVTATDDDLGRIYAVTGGNPLALWLVAGQAYDQPWDTFITDLVQHCPRGSTPYVLYDYLYRRTWDQLSGDARMVLFAMHRCETGADYELLGALSQLERPAFHLAVRELTQRMVLSFDGRYAIHRLTYTFLRVVIAGWWS